MSDRNPENKSYPFTLVGFMLTVLTTLLLVALLHIIGVKDMASAVTQSVVASVIQVAANVAASWKAVR